MVYPPMASKHEPTTSAADLDRLVHEPARLLILAQLSVVESADAVFLQRQTGLTWGNLSSHVGKLEDARYIRVDKKFVGKKPHTMLRITEAGREAFETYRRKIRQVLEAPAAEGETGTGS